MHFPSVINPENVPRAVCAPENARHLIDYKNREIDHSRCVAYMDCLDTCKHRAISIPDDGNGRPCNHLKQEQNPPSTPFSHRSCSSSRYAAAKREKECGRLDWLLFSTRKFEAHASSLSGAGSLRNMIVVARAASYACRSARTGCCALPLGWKHAAGIFCKARLLSSNAKCSGLPGRARHRRDFRPKKVSYTDRNPYAVWVKLRV